MKYDTHNIVCDLAQEIFGEPRRVFFSEDFTNQLKPLFAEAEKEKNILTKTGEKIFSVQEEAEQANKMLKNIILHTPNNAQVAARAAIEASLKNSANNGEIQGKDNFDGADDAFTREEFKTYAKYLEGEIEKLISNKSKNYAKESGEKAIDEDNSLSENDKKAAKKTNEALANAGQNIEEAMKSINDNIAKLTLPKDANEVDINTLKKTLKSHALSILAECTDNISEKNKNNAYVVSAALKDESEKIITSLIPAAQQYLYYQSSAYKQELKNSDSKERVESQVEAFQKKVLNAQNITEVPSGIYGNEKWWETALRWGSVANEMTMSLGNIADVALNGIDAKVGKIKEKAKSDDEKLGEEKIGEEASLKEFEGKLTAMNFLSPDLAEIDKKAQTYYLAFVAISLIPGIGESFDVAQGISFDNDLVVRMMKQMGVVPDNYEVEVATWEKALNVLGGVATLVGIGAITNRIRKAAKIAADASKIPEGEIVNAMEAIGRHLKIEDKGSRKMISVDNPAGRSGALTTTEKDVKKIEPANNSDILESNLPEARSYLEGEYIPRDNDRAALPPISPREPTTIDGEVISSAYTSSEPPARSIRFPSKLATATVVAGAVGAYALHEKDTSEKAPETETETETPATTAPETATPAATEPETETAATPAPETETAATTEPAPETVPVQQPSPPAEITHSIDASTKIKMQTFLKSKKSEFESATISLRGRNIALENIANNYQKGDWKEINTALVGIATNAGVEFPDWAKSDQNKVRYIQALVMGGDSESYLNYNGKAGPKTIAALLEYLK